MIKKRLQIAGAAVILAGAGFLPFKDALLTNDLLYKPFNYKSIEAAEGEGESFRGAAEFHHAAKADLITGQVDMAEYYKVLNQLDNVNTPRHKTGSFLQWREMGPDNIGGRTRSIVVDKDNPNTLYIGAVSGGVWKSTNGGTSWQRSGGRNLESLIVNTMVQTADGTLFYGTGEQNFTRGANGDGNSGFIGRGVFRSTDRGDNFEQLPATDPANPWAAGNSAWDNVNFMAAVPGSADKVYAGTQGGLMVTNDKGNTWSTVNVGAPASYQNCSEIVISPNGQVMYAVMHTRTMNLMQLYRSKDGGQTWQRSDNKGPDNVTPGLSRLAVAIAPSNQNVAYLSAASASNYRLDGIYYTDDAGESWKKIVTGGLTNDPFTGGVNGANAQGDYDNCIAVDPGNPNRFFVGGVLLYEGVKVGTQVQWGPIAFNFKAVGTYNPYWVHSDLHTFTFDTISKPYIMYIGTDGGVFKSTNISKQTENPMYIPLNNGYGSIQFYAMGVSPTSPDTVIGGTQDNGTLLTGRGGISEQNATSIIGGDGGYSAIGKIRRVYFGETQYGGVQRSLDGRNFSQFFDDNIPAPGEPQRYPFVTPFRLWEEFIYDTVVNDGGDTVIAPNPYASKLLIATYNALYFTAGALVVEQTPLFFKLRDLPGIAPHCVEISEDGDVAYVGGRSGSNGIVYRVTGLKNYRNFRLTYDSTAKKMVFNPDSNGVPAPRIIYSRPGQTVTGIALNPADPEHMVITLGSYGANRPHVEMTTNALATTPLFQNMSGNLPGFPVYGAAINPRNRNEVILGTEFGIWYTKDIRTRQWAEENNGMERVPAFMVSYKEYPGSSGFDGPIFFAATHGRGIFRTETLATVGIGDEKTVKHQPQFNIFPNPANEFTNLNLSLTKNTDVVISVYSMQGKLIETSQHRGQPAGERMFNLNTSAYKPGTYFVKVTAQGIDKTAKLLIVR